MAWHEGGRAAWIRSASTRALAPSVAAPTGDGAATAETSGILPALMAPLLRGAGPLFAECIGQQGTQPLRRRCFSTHRYEWDNAIRVHMFLQSIALRLFRPAVAEEAGNGDLEG